MINSPRVGIRAQSLYLTGQSVPEELRFAFAYMITIHNFGRFDLQLLRRYWLITDANGKTTEVIGDGVVGKQPIITSNTHYQYSSGTILETPLGTMQGHYEMCDHNGSMFNVEIPVFRLAIPSIIN